MSDLEYELDSAIFPTPQSFSEFLDDLWANDVFQREVQSSLSLIHI